MDSRDDFARDRDGRILTDSFGRPVRRRPAPRAGSGSSGSSGSTPGAGSRSAPAGSSAGSTGAATSRSDSARHGSRAGQSPTPPQYVRSDSSDAAGPRHARPRGSERAGHARGQQPQPPQYRHSPQQGAPGAGQRPQYAQPGAYGQAGQPGGYPPRQRPGQQPPRPAGYGQRPYPAGGSGRGADWGGPGRQPQRHAPSRRGGRRAARRRPRRRLGFGKILGLILVVLLVLGGGTALWADSQLQRTDALQNYDGRVGRTSGTNWLLVGSDSRAGLDQETADKLSAGMLDESEGRTDSIILVHIPLVGKATMVSLPRDSFVNIPGYGENKINAAFAMGGPALLQRTVEEATGLRIDHYAEVGFAGFANAVDGVGGVEMCLEAPLVDPMAGVDLPAGCQKLDGPNALGFVRSRYTSAGGDLDRADRQRQLLSALSKKMVSPTTLLNPFRLFPTVGGVAKALTVDNSDHMWHLARLGLKMRGAKQEVVPTSGNADNYAGSVLLWDEAGAEQLFSSLR